MASAATALYNVQMLKDKETLSNLDVTTTDNICWAVCKDTSQPVTGVATTTTRLKLLAFWIKHQDQTTHVVGTTAIPLVQTTLTMINLLRMQNALWMPGLLITRSLTTLP